MKVPGERIEYNDITKGRRSCCRTASRPSQARASFVHQTRVLPLDTAEGVRIDVIFALLPFELDAIRRAREVSASGRTIRVTPEDLILRAHLISRPSTSPS